MNYKEVVQDLFFTTEDYYLVHCISADFAMGKGIVVEFNKRFDMKKKIKVEFPDYLNSWKENEKKYDCILIEQVFNLITKQRFFNKPTYKTMRGSLELMKNICVEKQIQKIAMPIIGCGLDGLKWEKVSEIIKDVFNDIDIEILVCIPEV